MNKKEFATGMYKLTCFYSKVKALENEETMKVWFEYFKDYSLESYALAIDEHIKRERYTPTVASLTDYIEAKSKKRLVDNSKYIALPETYGDDGY